MLIGIRAITYTISLEKIKSQEYLDKVQSDLFILIEKFKQKAFKIRTLRFNIIPIKPNELDDIPSLLSRVELLSDFCKKIGFRWFNISFDLDTNSSEAIHKTCDFGYKILQTFENAFVNFIFPNKYVCSEDYTMLNKYLVEELTKILSLIEKVSIDFQDKFSLKYNGMDISLAPYPEEDVSVISLHKLLGLQEFGASGTQFSTAY